ncbi:actin-binding protein WASF1-like [Hoplias malabaricus]|uniref:actin-binding protein WASF1-like n=1 Tax=Hoplias malabaricus TaxID=27720 RepID=UPI003462982A
MRMVGVLLILLQLSPSTGLRSGVQNGPDVWLTGFEPVFIDGSPVPPPCSGFPFPDEPEGSGQLDNTTPEEQMHDNPTPPEPIPTIKPTPGPLPNGRTTTVKPPVIPNQPNPLLTLYILLLAKHFTQPFPQIPRYNWPLPPPRGLGYHRFPPHFQGALLRPGPPYWRRNLINRRWLDSSDED